MYTEPRAKKVDLSPSPKKGSDKINRLKQRRKTQKSKLYCTARTHIWMPSLKEGDLEGGAKGDLASLD